MLSELKQERPGKPKNRFRKYFWVLADSKENLIKKWNLGNITSTTNVHLNLKLKLRQLKKPKKGKTLIGV